MTGNQIKANLMILGKRQIDLLEELRKSGKHPNISAPTLSASLSGSFSHPAARSLVAECSLIVEEWLREAGQKRA